MKIKYSIAALALSTMAANAAITYVHTYALGESGSLGVNDRPQDGTGSAHFSNGLDTANASTAGGSAPGTSTAHLNFTDSANGYWNAGFSGLATDNFAIEIWARMADTSQSVNLFSTGNGNSNSIELRVDGGSFNAVILTPGGGSTVSLGSVTAVADEWTHLAAIRHDGVTTFYVNHVAQTASASTVSVAHGGGLLGINSGATDRYAGDLDEAKIFTFGSADDPVAALQAVPEPSSAALIGLGGFALILRRRK